MNSVEYILKNRPLEYEDKILIRDLGRPTPSLQIQQLHVVKTRQFNRLFKRETSYDKFLWMCGCAERNRFFCFICLLSNDVQSSPWIQKGVADIQHLAERAIKHAKSVSHLHHLVEFSVLGKPDIRKQLDCVYLQNIRAHNEQVDRNRYILRRLIMCVRFCGAFELALLGQDEQSHNQGIFRGLVDFAAEIDSALSSHLKEATLFNGTPKSIQNELLDAMLQVCKSEIRNQIAKSKYLAIEVDETTDSFNQQQLVIIFRYVYEGEVFERFWGFFKPAGYKAEQIADVILDELKGLDISPNKLIAQSYDVAAVMSKQISDVQTKIREVYPYAFYVHCYAHQFNLLLERAASCNKKLKIFFAEVQAFTSFFSRSPKQIEILDGIAKQRLPWVVPPTSWNFKTGTIGILYEQKIVIQECLDKMIEWEIDSKTICEANGLLKNLHSEDFNFFLEIIYLVTRHIEIFFNQIQSQSVDSAYVIKSLNNFESEIMEIRNEKIDQVQHFQNVDNVDEENPPAKRAKSLQPDHQDGSVESNRTIAKEYCDIIITQIKDRFLFSGHLSAAKLFDSDLFPNFNEHFPEDIFKQTVQFYDFLDKEKLRAELKVLYEREDMSCNGLLPVLMFLFKNNLQEGLSELHTLLNVVCTTPMATCECARCFSTLKRIKSFLRNTMGQERLDALAMLSIEKKLIQTIPNFDDEVIKVFSASKDRGMDFHYK